MRKLKRRLTNILITLVACSLLPIACDENTDKHQIYTLNATQSGFRVYQGKYYEFGVELEMTSKSDTLPPFYLMTCAWGSRNAFTSKSQFISGYHACDLNYLGMVKIATEDTLKLTTIIRYMGEIKDFRETELKIGIVIVDTIDVSFRYNRSFNSQEIEEYYHFEDSLEERFNTLNKERDEVVWSNPFKLTLAEDTIKYWGGVWWIQNRVDESN